MTEPLGIDAQAVGRRAHELWLRRGCPTGTPELDWLEAERELRAEAARLEVRPAASAPRVVDPPRVPQPPRPRAPRTIITRSAHGPAARLLAALVPEAGTDHAAALARAASRR